MESLPAGEVEVLPKAMHAELFPHLPHGVAVRMGTHPDGTCFQHSLCAAINFDDYLSKPLPVRQEIGQRFRCSLRDHLTQDVWDSIAARHPGNLRMSTLADVKANFCKPSVWSDEALIKSTSEMMGLNILFVDVRDGGFYCMVNGDESALDTVAILWQNHQHFEPILFVRKCDDCGDGDHTHLNGRLHKDRDRTTVKALVQRFADVCRAASPKAIKQIEARLATSR